MKKIIIKLVFLLILPTLFSNDVLEKDQMYWLDIESYLAIYNGYVYYNSGELIPREAQIEIDSDGYVRIDTEDKDFILLPGEHMGEVFDMEILESEYFLEYYQKNYPPAPLTYKASVGVESIEASSTLTEQIADQELIYSTSMLQQRYLGDCSCHSYEYNHYTVPWVEGVEGDGIGETIAVTFDEAKSEISILNGYVDLVKRNLYKENNRLKKIRIVSESFDIEYTFEDYVHFAHIEFPAAVGSITIEILSVYPGRKWSDTCISYITPKQNVSNMDYFLKDLERRESSSDL
jgi:hypothetical protein